MTPRQRAAAAFAELDAIDRRCHTTMRESDDLARKESALLHLAGAMDEIYGPLPAERATVLRVVSYLPGGDSEIRCAECAGTGLQDGPDGAPCEWCSGTGMW
jgi:hypothetical protein